MRMCTPELKAVNGITVISSDKNEAFDSGPQCILSLTIDQGRQPKYTFNCPASYCTRGLTGGLDTLCILYPWELSLQNSGVSDIPPLTPLMFKKTTGTQTCPAMEAGVYPKCSGFVLFCTEFSLN